MTDSELSDSVGSDAGQPPTWPGDLFVGRVLVVQREHGSYDYFPLMDNDDWVVQHLPQPETVLSARAERLILARLCPRDAQGGRCEGPWRVFPTVRDALDFLRGVEHEPTAV